MGAEGPAPWAGIPAEGVPQPLSGRTVLVTRAGEQAGDLAERLEARGARVEICPVIALAPPLDPLPFTRALQDLERYDWILFTSANAVRRVAEADTQRPWPRVACVGRATAEAVAAAGRAVDVTARDFVAEGLLAALYESTDGRLAGLRFLLPRAAEAREVLPEGLRAAGATVDVVTAYRTLPDAAAGSVVRSLLRDGRVDVLTFTSSSTVRHFDALLDEESRARARALPTVCLGPVTAETARGLGFSVAAVASPSTAAGLAEAVAALFAE